jgi:predicted ATPase
LAAWIVERTGGNPFYVEEIVRALIENGSLTGAPGGYKLVRPLDHATVPPTVHAGGLTRGAECIHIRAGL